MLATGVRQFSRAERMVLACYREALNLEEQHGQIWPGWKLSSVPFLFYRPGGKRILVRHPAPPTDFVKVENDPIVGCDIYVSDTWNDLKTDPPVINGYRVAMIPVLDINSAWGGYERVVGLMFHEGFHVHQEKFKLKPTVSQFHKRYPELSPVNNAMGNMEGQVLYDALNARDSDTLWELIATFALVRRERRKDMDDLLIRYEREIELKEGLARYLEIMALTMGCTGEYSPHWAFREATGLEKYTSSEAFIQSQVDTLKEINLNGWGADEERFHYTGMAIAFILDKVAPGWKRNVEKKGMFLDEVLETTVSFDGGPQDDKLISQAEAKYGYVDLLEKEKHYTKQELQKRQEALSEILQGQGTHIVFDVKGLTQTASRFVPTELQRVSEMVRIYRRLACFEYSSTVLEFEDIPVVEDEKLGLFHVCIKGNPVFEGDNQRFLIGKAAEFTEGLDITIPGMRVRAKKGYIQNADGVIYIKIQR